MKRLFIIIVCIAVVFSGCRSDVEENESKQVPQQNMTSKVSNEGVNEAASQVLPNSETTQQGSAEAAASSEIKDISAGVNPEKLTSKRKTSYEHFNTICYAIVYDDFSSPDALARFEDTWQEIDNMLTVLENKASVNIVGSDIYKFNEAKYGESIAINSVTAEIVSEAIEMYNLTGGAYNPAVSNLVDLWGFSPRFLNNEKKAMPYDRSRNESGGFDLPNLQYIEAFKKLSDFSGVKLIKDKKGGYLLKKEVMDIEINGELYSLKIDLGGIAKGYGADKAAEILKKNGYEYGLVNLGLSSMKLLKRNVSDKGAPSMNMWSIYISNPDNPSENYLTGFGKNVGVSTSGTYEVKYINNGREYSHIIDPTTGEPTRSDIVSVSIWGEEASEADALSTALCVMGKKKAVEFMNAHLQDYKVALLIRNGNNIEVATNMKDGEYLTEMKTPKSPN
ncbi:MAG: FAD:protein transferase [Clostridia bacterium]|jgi:thiamine biosynthesis lipoprotein|nr:FAD:protein transferase [Clostridia bacterium]